MRRLATRADEPTQRDRSPVATGGVGTVRLARADFDHAVQHGRDAVFQVGEGAERAGFSDGGRCTPSVAPGGSTLRDFIGVNGQSGYFQQTYFTYNRTGKPCRVCGAPIRQIVQGQRSTFYCVNCQK